MSPKSQSSTPAPKPYQFLPVVPIVQSRADIIALSPDEAYTYFNIESAVWKARMMLINRGEWGAGHHMPNWAISKLLHAIDYLTGQQQTIKVAKAEGRG